MAILYPDEGMVWMPEYSGGYYSRGIKAGLVGKAGPFLSSLAKKLLARRLTRALGAGKVVEVGFGDGSFLWEMAHLGWDALGMDTSEEAVRLAGRLTGISVTREELESAGLDESSFDLVVMRHLLEHVEEPESTLTHAHRVLRPGGSIYVEVPNAASLEASIAGNDWFHLDPEFHMSQFTPVSLRAALEKADFHQVRVSHMTLEYRQTLTYGILSRLGFSFSADNLTHGRKLLMYTLLPPGVVLSFAFSLLGKGGVISAMARKTQKPGPPGAYLTGASSRFGHSGPGPGGL